MIWGGKEIGGNASFWFVKNGGSWIGCSKLNKCSNQRVNLSVKWLYDLYSITYYKGWSLRLFSGRDIFFWKKSFLPTTTFIWHYISIYLIWQTLLWKKKINLISWIQQVGKYQTSGQLHFWTVFSMNNIFSKFFFMLLAEKKS